MLLSWWEIYNSVFSLKLLEQFLVFRLLDVFKKELLFNNYLNPSPEEIPLLTLHTALLKRILMGESSLIFVAFNRKLEQP